MSAFLAGMYTEHSSFLLGVGLFLLLVVLILLVIELRDRASLSRRVKS